MHVKLYEEIARHGLSCLSVLRLARREGLAVRKFPALPTKPPKSAQDNIPPPKLSSRKLRRHTGDLPKVKDIHPPKELHLYRRAEDRHVGVSLKQSLDRCDRRVIS